MFAGGPVGQCAVSPEAGVRRVAFTFRPDRRYERVFLAGTFNGWSPDATEMVEIDGRYEVVLPLAAGEYEYKFVADGRWITDEAASRFCPDGFGGRNSVIVVDDSFPKVDLRRRDGRIMAEGLSHNQRPWECSLNSDGSVTVRMRTWANDVSYVQIWLDRLGVSPFRPVGPFDSDGIYDYFEMTIDKEYVDLCSGYEFLLLDAGALVWVGPDGTSADRSSVGDYPLDVSELTVFDTPDWVKEAVFYQIFPDRFANGDPTNDPDFSEWYYEGVSDLPPSGTTNGEYFHLVSDWYDVAGLRESPYKTNGKPDWNSFYGGDIEGVRANLDYIVDLGVTAIYFNPIFEAKSNHKYDAATYMKVDPHFGTNDSFKAFVDECHSRGVRVILDLAVNHTGHTFWAFVDARTKGPESEFWNWYEWKSWPVPGGPEQTPPNPLEYYDCWSGFGQMPTLNFDLSRASSAEQSVRSVADAVPNEPLVGHLLDVAAYWVDEIGIDGYRLDVAAEVPPWFWEAFRSRVKELSPDAYIVGELWGASPEWVNGRYFDAVMNYRFFRDPVLSFIGRAVITAEEFDRELATGRLTYPHEGVLAQMNILSTHDTERFLTAAGGDVRRLKLAALFAMTYVGAPTIYYGDEIAMEGGRDPDCRRPFYWKWADEPERSDVHECFRTLAHLRRAHPCLTEGSFETLVASGRVFAFRRRLGGESLVVVLNAGERETSVSVELGRTAKYPQGAGRQEMVPLYGPAEAVSIESDGEIDYFVTTLPPLAGAVLRPVRR